MAIRILSARERQLITGGTSAQTDGITDLDTVYAEPGNDWDNPYDVTNDGGGGDWYYDNTGGGDGGGGSGSGSEEDDGLLSEIDPELKEAAKAFLEVVEAGLLDGHTPFSKIDVAVEYGDLSASLVELTMIEGLRDIEYWQQINGHLTFSQGSLLNWSQMQVDWGQYGANDSANSPEDVLGNYFEAILDSNAAASSTESDGASGDDSWVGSDVYNYKYGPLLP